MEIGRLADIVAFVLPGYLATELYGLLVRTKKRDDFERLAVSLFFSLAAFGLACAAVWGFYRDDWHSRVAVSIENWCFLVAIFLIALLLGGAWAAITRWRWMCDQLRGINVYHSHHPNVWNALWESKEDAWVVVQLDDGSECCGAVKLFSNDPDEAIHELWLFPVLMKSADNGYSQKAGVGVFIPGDRIVSISAYRSEDQPAAAAAE